MGDKKETTCCRIRQLGEFKKDWTSVAYLETLGDLGELGLERKVWSLCGFGFQTLDQGNSQRPAERKS